METIPDSALSQLALELPSVPVDMLPNFLHHREIRKQKTSVNWTHEDFNACKAIITRKKTIRHILTRPQKAYYDAFKSKRSKEFGMVSCRKIGKSYVNLLIAYEHCLNNPGHIVLIVLPELAQAKEIYYPIYDEVSRYLPPEMLPRLMRSKGKIYFKNGSIIKLGGAKPENVESLRGPQCHLLILDEVGFFDASNFWNALNSIIKPQMALTEGCTLYTTTPPESPDHPFIERILPRLKANDTWIEFTCFDNPLMSESSIMDTAADYGGYDSLAFQREYLAQLIADQSLRVCPEFKPETHVIETLPALEDLFGNDIADWQTFQILDMGLVDHTGILSGYYDYFRQKLVVVEEQWFDGTVPGYGLEYMADRWNEQLQRIRDICDTIEPITVIDCFDQVGFELRQKYGLRFNRPKKGKQEETVAMLRNCFQLDKVEILSKCKQLIYELNNGVWKENKKDFLRTELAGHLDLLMCLAYMCREVRWNKTPGQNTASEALSKIGVSYKKFTERKPLIRKTAHVKTIL